MNVMVVILAALLLLSGCAVPRETGAISHQELVTVSALPAYRATRDMLVHVAFKVRADGSVEDVQILQSAANADWDAEATQLMKQWRFSPLAQGRETEGRWLQYSLVVHIEEPLVMVLGEIATATQEQADSLYDLLDNDIPFASIARQATTSSGESAKFLGAVDIAAYPQHVRDELRKLGVNSFTRPLRLGDRFVIYMRFEEEPANGIVQ